MSISGAADEHHEHQLALLLVGSGKFNESKSEAYSFVIRRKACGV